VGFGKSLVAFAKVGQIFGPVIRTEREVSPAATESPVLSAGTADDIGNNVSKANAILISIMARPALSVYFCLSQWWYKSKSLKSRIRGSGRAQPATFFEESRTKQATPACSPD